MNNLVIKNRNILSKTNYVRKANAKRGTYWVDFRLSKMEKYIDEFAEDFKLIIFGSESEEGDFFAIPYIYIKHIFTENNLSNDKEGKVRWIGNINNGKLKLSRCEPIDVTDFYGNPTLISYSSEEKQISKEIKQPSDEEKNEYAIQNRKREIEVRQKQSVFRQKVLSNFEGKCCLTEISENELLIASHIVPWSKRIDIRLDPSNGLCLSALYDKLFDRGFITFEDNLQVRVTSKHNSLSPALKSIILSMKNSQAKAKEPINYPIKPEYLEYHRDVVFLK